jgi:hypothetical protein
MPTFTIHWQQVGDTTLAWQAGRSKSDQVDGPDGYRQKADDIGYPGDLMCGATLKLSKVWDFEILGVCGCLASYVADLKYNENTVGTP